MTKNERTAIDKEIIDFSFYLIQRGESGHKSGCKTERYRCSARVLTIGYGTTHGKKHNLINYPYETIDEKTAVFLARAEMYNKLYQKCRTNFPNKKGRATRACFDTMLPCYQAVVLDMAYQGVLTEDFVNAVLWNNMSKAMKIAGTNKNEERAAVRGRAIAMGMEITKYQKLHPSVDPQEAARAIAAGFLEKYNSITGDREVTRDELALLYRSTMVAYKQPVTQEEAEKFANSFENVAIGRQGVGDRERLATDGLVEKETALEYLTPTQHRNNPKDAFNSEGTKSVGYDTLQDGYNALINRLKGISKKGKMTSLELWRSFTGVRGVRGWQMMERLRANGIDVDEDTKFDLTDPKVMKAVALSISEMNHGSFALGGKEEATAMIASIVDKTPMPTVEKKIDPKTQEKKASEPEKKAKQKTKTPPVAQAAETTDGVTVRVAETGSHEYEERRPSSLNGYNNPGKISNRRGRNIKYATLKEGYADLTSLLARGYNNLSCREICRKFMGGRDGSTQRLVGYLKSLGVQVGADAKLDLNDAKTLENLTIAVGQLRNRGRILGGIDYARHCVVRKIEELKVQGDGVTLMVDPNAVDATRGLIPASQALQSDVYKNRVGFDRTA